MKLSRALGSFFCTLVGVCCLLWIGCSRNRPDTASEPGAASPPAAELAPPKPSPAPPAPRRVTLEEGTVLKIRTTSTLSTKTAVSGDAFAATLAEPLVVGNDVVAPKGATVSGRVAESDPGGRVQGVARLAVRLTQLELSDGRTIDIVTGALARQASTTKKKDATKVGIASGVGAAIGAIAGGGKGAAIGAAAGAGAGGGVVLATHGEPAVIPSESPLTFRLRSPVTVELKQ